jgi:hypothetical protein
MHRVDQRDQLADVAVDPLRIGACDVVGQRELGSREREQRPALGLVEPKRVCERVKHFWRARTLLAATRTPLLRLVLGRSWR